MLKLKGIDVAYGGLQALVNVSLEVGAGELVALLGANGAGKTTTLKTISGILRPSAGAIEFAEEEISRWQPHRIAALGIAHVPEGRRLFPEMTVRENLELGALRPEAKQKRRQTLEWVFTLFPVLRDRQQQPAGTLSGGEQQMLAIGRGLMSVPKLLMLDEPSLGLAPVLVKHVFEIIKQINQQGITVLLVEQNVMQVLRFCHRGYILENGRIVLTGTGVELLNSAHVKDRYLGI